MALLLSTSALQCLALAVAPQHLLKRSVLSLSFAQLASLLLLWARTDLHSGVFSQVLCLGDDWVCLGVCYTSLWVLSLSAFLFPLCVVLVQGRRAVAAFVGIQTCTLVALLSLDLVFFYVAFESSLILLFLLIGRKGYGSLSAAYSISIYTFSSALCFLATAFAVYFSTGSTNVLMAGETTHGFVAAGLFALMAVKAPLMPVHLWLPEAHVYAPTAGSVMLAGVILKISVVGLHLYVLPFYGDFLATWFPAISALCFTSFLWSSYSTLKQIDLKKIVAYSSISHMAIVTLAALANSGLGLQGSVLYCVAHGLVSPALFLLVGVLYKHTHTKLLLYIRGLSYTAPVLWAALVFFTLGNLSFPLFPNFIAELVCLAALFQVHELYAYVFIVFSALSTIYSSVMLGKLKGGESAQLLDVSRADAWLIAPLFISTVVTGFGML